MKKQRQKNNRHNDYMMPKKYRKFGINILRQNRSIKRLERFRHEKYLKFLSARLTATQEKDTLILRVRYCRKHYAVVTELNGGENEQNNSDIQRA